MALALFIAGLSISPTIITGFSLVERMVPAAQLNEGMAWITTSINLGVAVGSWAGMRYRRVRGVQRVRLSYACALLAAVVGLGGWRWSGASPAHELRPPAP